MTDSGVDAGYIPSIDEEPELDAESINVVQAKVADLWYQAVPYLPLLPVTDHNESETITTNQPALVVAIHNIYSRGANKEPLQTQEDLIGAVAEHFDLEAAQILGKSRKPPVVRARQAIAYIMRNNSSLSLVEIGSILGRDHSTIQHAIHKAEERLASDDLDFKRAIQALGINLRFATDRRAITVLGGWLYELATTTLDDRTKRVLDLESKLTLDWPSRATGNQLWAKYGATAQMLLERVLSDHHAEVRRRLGSVAMPR